MKQKKTKKPKDALIQSVLDDLKDIPEDSIVIGPEGIQGRDLEKEHIDATHVLGSDYTGSNENDFAVPAHSVLGDLQNQVEDEAPINAFLSSGDDSAADSGKAKDLVVDEPLHFGSHNSEEELTSVPAGSPPEGMVELAIESDEQNSQDKTEVAASPKPVVQVHRSEPKPLPPKVSFGGGKGKGSPFETQFAQAENLKLAQNRILDLEKEIERLRKDNELLSSAAEISRQRMDELAQQIHHLERQKHDLKEVNESELQIFKEGLTAKDSEILRLRNKVDELESRLSNDLRKVRVRERELENRLELSKAEKAALLRAKDDNILELKRKTESLESEVENYQNKIIELSQKIELNQEQFARTVRALRLALTNLEVSDGTSASITLAPLKKAE